MPARDRDARHRPIGPFAPPLPKDAEETRGGEPMAVANDKANLHGESFVGTSAPRDQWDEEIAKKFGRPVERARSDQWTRKMQAPEGYTRPDEDGWARPIDDGDDASP